MERRASLSSAEREIERIEARRKKLVQSIMEGVPAKRLKLGELNRIAKKLRVQRVMRPTSKRMSCEARRPQEHRRLRTGATR
jgi:hypothetical protein